VRSSGGSRSRAPALADRQLLVVVEGEVPRRVDRTGAVLRPRPPTPTQPTIPKVLRGRGSRPNRPSEGTDTLHKNRAHGVVMMEKQFRSHSEGQVRNLGGATDSAEQPRAKPLDSEPHGRRQLRARLSTCPSTCQPQRATRPELGRSQQVFSANGKNSGFVKARLVRSRGGYWDTAHNPFYYDLAKTFPLCDEIMFGAGETYRIGAPHRGNLRRGNSQHQHVNSTKSPPANGTILAASRRTDQVARYYSDLPGGRHHQRT